MGAEALQFKKKRTNIKKFVTGDKNTHHPSLRNQIITNLLKSFRALRRFSDFQPLLQIRHLVKVVWIVFDKFVFLYSHCLSKC